MISGNSFSLDPEVLKKMWGNTTQPTTAQTQVEQPATAQPEATDLPTAIRNRWPDVPIRDLYNMPGATSHYDSAQRYGAARVGDYLASGMGHLNRINQRSQEVQGMLAHGSTPQEKMAIARAIPPKLGYLSPMSMSPVRDKAGNIVTYSMKYGAK
jgi:hypothetical protein